MVLLSVPSNKLPRQNCRKTKEDPLIGKLINKILVKGDNICWKLVFGLIVLLLWDFHQLSE